MGQISLTFPDSTYTSSNKPSVETLKADLSAIETGVNANQTAAVETTDTDVSGNSWVLDEDAMGSDSNQKVPTQQSVKAYVDAAITAAKAALYPVGSYYINETVATNPGTLLGFGTWEAVEGKTIVGKAATGTFNTAGATGGAETVTLTAAQSGIPAHSHTITDPGHIHSINYENATRDSGGLTANVFPGSVEATANSNSATTGITINNNSAANASSAHSNLQPYIVAHIWKRTA